MLSDLHKHLLNDYQRDFPCSEQPYREIADDLGVSEQQVLSALTELSEQQFISRVGPVIRPNHIGVSCLVAMAVPPEQLESIAEIVNSYQEVNHNYERENRFNLWFVVIAANQTHLDQVLCDIEQHTGHTAMPLPLIRDYFINLGFELNLHD